MKRNLIENLTIQSNIPCYRARLAGNLYVVSDYSPTFDKVEYYVSQIMDSRFSFIAPARLVVALVMRAMVCTYTDFLCTFVWSRSYLCKIKF